MIRNTINLFLIVSLSFIAYDSNSQTQKSQIAIDNVNFYSLKQLEKINKNEFAVILDYKADSARLIKYNDELKEQFSIPLIANLFYNPERKATRSAYRIKFNQTTQNLFLLAQFKEKKKFFGSCMLIDSNDGSILNVAKWWEDDETKSNYTFSESGQHVIAFKIKDREEKNEITLRILRTDLASNTTTTHPIEKDEAMYPPTIINDEEIMITVIPERQDEFKLIFVDMNGKKIKEIVQPLELSGNEYYGQYMNKTLDEDHSLVGFTRTIRGELTGLDLWKVNRKSKSVEMFKKLTFDKEFLKNMVSPNYYPSPLSTKDDPNTKRYVKLKDVGSYRISDLYLLENGEIVVRAEDQRDEYKTSTDGRGGYSIYERNNQLLMGLDLQGSLKWISVYGRDAQYVEGSGDINTFKPADSNILAITNTQKNILRMCYTEGKKRSFAIIYREIDLKTGLPLKYAVMDEYEDFSVNSYYSNWISHDNLILLTGKGTEWVFNQNEIVLRSITVP